MSTTALRSDSCMLRIVTCDSPTASCLATAMTQATSGKSRANVRRCARQLGTHPFQIRPGAALLARTAQQIRRMIGHDHGRDPRAEMMQLATQAPDRSVGRQQTLRCNSAHHQDQSRRYQLNLSLQIWQARGYLSGAGIAIAWRPTLQYVGDVHRFTPPAYGAQHRIEQLTGPSDERLALAILLGTGRLTDDEQFGAAVADPQYGLRAGPAQPAQCAAGHLTRNALPQARATGCAARRGGRAARAQRPHIHAQSLKVLLTPAHVPCSAEVWRSLRLERRIRRHSQIAGAHNE